MAVNLRVLVPEATTNYVTNPSLRYDTTGYTAVGSSISRSLDQARFNIASLKVSTNGASLYEGAYYRVSSLSGTSQPITASVYLRGTGIVRLRLINNPAGQQWYSQQIELKGRWVRASVSGYSTGTNDLRIYVETDRRSQAVEFYVDGVQLEVKAYLTSFCDGDQSGCRWNGLYHASTSTRNATEGNGGRWVDLAGPCRADDNLYVTLITGLGMSPQSIQKQPWALGPGSFFQNRKILDRSVAFAFHVKNAKRVRGGHPNLSALHYLRQQLIDILKPDRTVAGQELIFEYQEGDKAIYFGGRYESGLDGSWDARNQWINSFSLSLAVLNPMPVEDDTQVQQLRFKEKYASSGNCIPWATRRNGVWYPLSPDGTGYISTTYGANCVGIGNNGEVYLSLNSSSAVPADKGAQLWRWDGTTMTRIGVFTYLGSWGFVYDVLMTPNGDLYASGKFTSVDGVAASCIARYDGTWHALGAGLTGGLSFYGGAQMCLAQNGHIYVVGDFYNAGGLYTPGCAKWDGAQWYRVGQANGMRNNGGTEGVVLNIERGIDDRSLYVCGGYHDVYQADGIILSGVARIDITTDLYEAMGSGFNQTVNAMAVSKDGTVYVFGAFSANGAGTKVINRVAFWNGEDWFQLGEPGSFTLNEYQGVIKFDAKENMYITGAFRDVGGVVNSNIAKWSGDRRTTGKWSAIDVVTERFGGLGFRTGAIQDMAVHPNGDLFIVTGNPVQGTGTRRLETASINYVTCTGTARVFPRLYVRGPGHLQYLENQTSGKILHFNFDILANEEVFIDFGKAHMISSTRGDVSYGLLDIASLSEFYLVPGENKIAVLMTDDVNALMQLAYTPTHWGADASAKIEALS